MSWVAFDRAIRLSVDRARPVDLAKWTSARDQVYRAIMDKDWNDSLNAFVQYEGGRARRVQTCSCRWWGSLRLRMESGYRRCRPWTALWYRTAW